MKQKLRLLLTLIVLASYHSYAQQPQQKIWYMDDKIIDFSSGTPAVGSLVGSPSASEESTNGAYDANGNLLFYINDLTIYDKTGSVMGSIRAPGSGLGSHGAETIIVPKPGDCNHFIIIYSADAFAYTSPADAPCNPWDDFTNVYWVEVDMNANGFLGSVSGVTELFGHCEEFFQAPSLVARDDIFETYFFVSLM